MKSDFDRLHDANGWLWGVWAWGVRGLDSGAENKNPHFVGGDQDIQEVLKKKRFWVSKFSWQIPIVPGSSAHSS